MKKTDLQEMRNQDGGVHCGSCRACCKSDTIRLTREDDLDSFKWHLEGGVPVLDRKPNGECIYLTEKGCSIYDRHPAICRRFDCRVLFMLTPKTVRKQRIQQNPTMRAVYAAGKARLETLKVEA